LDNPAIKRAREAPYFAIGALFLEESTFSPSRQNPCLHPAKKEEAYPPKHSPAKTRHKKQPLTLL
jgi:hypothetical protein